MAWTFPAVGPITSPYGPRVLAGAIGTFHYGTDIGAKRGPVYAAQDGTVRTIWRTSKDAWVVDLRHPDEDGQQIRTRYVHMYRSEVVVAIGQHVAAGQQIGRSGASGTGAAHLHFEVLVDGHLIDPVPFLAARGVHLGAEPVVDVVAATPPAPTPVVIPTLPAPLNPQSEEDDMIALITFFYTHLLGRQPSSGEVYDRIGEFSGWLPIRIRDWFLASRAEPGTVVQAFREYLGSDPSAAQIAEWANGRTVAQVRAGIAGSPAALARR